MQLRHFFSLVLLLGFLAPSSSTARAANFFEYEIAGTNCKVESYPGLSDGMTIISIVQPGAGSVSLRMKDGQVYQINSCNEPMIRSSRGLPVMNLEEGSTDTVTSYSRCGGVFYVYDNVARIEVNKQSGKIENAFALTRYAKWGLPNGIHSGPYKGESAHIVCNAEGWTADRVEKLLNQHPHTVTTDGTL